MFQRLEKNYGHLVNLLALLAAVAVLIMTIIVTLNVALRGTGLGSISWTDEVSEYLLYGVTLLSAPWLMRRGGHISIDILFHLIPKAAARRVSQLGDAIGIAAALTTAWYGLRVTIASYGSGMVTIKSLVFPEWILIAPFPLIFAMLAYEFSRRLFAGGCDD